MAWKLFTDGSVDPQSKIGYGAMLLVEATDDRRPELLDEEIVLHRFQPTSSSKLEVETMLWALGSIGPEKGGLTVFTDSQTLVGLPGRRGGLEAAGYCSRKGLELGNADLYRNFYEAMDRLGFALRKLEGHRPAEGKTRDEMLFTLVDRASRKALRKS